MYDTHESHKAPRIYTIQRQKGPHVGEKSIRQKDTQKPVSTKCGTRRKGAESHVVWQRYQLELSAISKLVGAPDFTDGAFQ